jgi:outer membrane protein assembly factor BamB
VYTVGAEGKVQCLDLATGKIIWKKFLNTDYKVPQDFFGTASTPLIEGGLLILNVGAPGGPCVVALDKATGREAWRAGKEWGPSYASPVPAVIHGKRRVFVFAGGESNPPSGGLLSIDPASGKVDFTFPWRSRSYESVNASCPVVFDNKVFISASYRTGGALIEVNPDFTHRVLWTTAEFGLHFNTPIFRNGCLYGFDGRNEPDSLAHANRGRFRFSAGAYSTLYRTRETYCMAQVRASYAMTSAALSESRYSPGAARFLSGLRAALKERRLTTC